MEENSMDELLRQSPFGPLLDIEGVDGAEDIFGNLPADDGAGNPFGSGTSSSGDLAYGGNPFAGENFWNIFAGGVNPSYINLGGDFNAWF